MRGVLSRAAFAVIVLAIGRSALAGTPDDGRRSPGAADVPANWRPSLASDDTLEVIRTLVKLAEAGPAAGEAEDAVAALLTESARGKILSRWCFRALASISGDPERHVKRYLAAAGWLHYNVVKVGEAGVIGGPTPDMVGPEIPEELGGASRRAWITGIETAMRLLRSSEGAEMRRLREVLEKMGAPEDVMVPRLAEVMLDVAVPSPTREGMARLIGNYGHSAASSAASMEPLLAGLKDDNPRVRLSCARSLGQLAYPYEFYGGSTGPPAHPRPVEAVEALVRALRDPDAHVRAACADALGYLHKDHRENDPPLPAPRPALATAIAAMVEALNDPEHEVRAAVHNAFARMGRNALDAEQALVAHGALTALSAIGGPRAGKALVDALRKAPNQVAVAGLGRLARLQKRRGRENQLAALAAQAVPLMIQHLESGRLTGSAPENLALFGRHARDAVPVLHDLLRNSPYMNVKGRCMFALGLIGPASREAVPGILRCMSIKRSGSVSAYTHWGLRFGIALALGRIGEGGKDVEAALLELSCSDDCDTRREAAKSLGVVAKESEAVTKALERLLDDDDKDVREEAAKAIQAIRARAGGAEPTEGIDDTF